MTPKDVTGIILIVAATIAIFAIISTAFTLYSISTMLDSGFIEKRLAAGLENFEIDCNSSYVEQAIRIEIDTAVLYCTIS